MFKQTTGVELAHAPYPAAPRWPVNDLIAGQVDVMFEIL